MFEFPDSPVRRAALVLLAVGFMAIGVAHFTHTEFFVAIMPPYLPAHFALVYLSGIAEIAGGLGVLFAATRAWARIGLVALLVAVYPANIHMAMNPEPFVAEGLSPAALYARLPMQFVFMAWVWWAARPGRD
jgi:uncharacterized membrane protein